MKMLAITIDKIEKKMKKLNSGDTSISDPVVESGNAHRGDIIMVRRILNVDIETVDGGFREAFIKIDYGQEQIESDYRGSICQIYVGEVEIISTTTP
jgi:hypothetical protein